MKSYAVLHHPGHNRVYFEASKKFSINEMNILGRRLSSEIINIKSEEIAGVPYITFDSAQALTADDLKILGRLSFLYALYEKPFEPSPPQAEDSPPEDSPPEPGAEESADAAPASLSAPIIPIAIPKSSYMDPGLSGMLKYTGKTNEIFTRMLLNIAVFSSDCYDDPNLKILDPIAGKGTTLFEGLICGYNVYGIEIGNKVVSEVYHFFKKYLEGEKYKHSADIIRISGPNRVFTAQRHYFRLSKLKKDFDNKIFKEFEIIGGSSQYADTYYKKDEFDIIVGDLPYGVQHGSVTRERQSSMTRNPKELLRTCLPVWREVLKTDGIMALSWNTLILNKKIITDIIRNTGFYVFEGENYDSLEHRIDQSIKRNIIVAKKV